MRMFGGLAVAVAAAALCFSADQAFADFVNNGPIRLSNSWIDPIAASTTVAEGSFDKIVMTANGFVTWSDFEGPTAADNFAISAGWSQTALTTAGPNGGFTSLTISSGSLASLSAGLYRLNFDLHLTNFPANGLALTAVFYNGTTQVRTDTFTVAHLVPVPVAAWSGLAMLAGMGAFLAKRRRDRSLLA